MRIHHRFPFIAAAAFAVGHASDRTKRTPVRVERPTTPTFEAPAQLAQRFEGDVLAEAIRAVLTETGIDGEVNTVDCSEFPCLVHGRVDLGFPADHGRLRALVAAVREGYEGDGFYVSKSTFEGGSEDAYQLFAASFYPPDLPQAPAMERRLRTRKNDYFDRQRE